MLNMRRLLCIITGVMALQKPLCSMKEKPSVLGKPSLVAPLTWQTTPKTIEIINTIEKNILDALVEVYSSGSTSNNDVYELLNLTEYPESSKLIDYIVKDELSKQKDALKASITPSLLKNMKHLIALLERILLDEILLQCEHDTPLKWCPCITPGDRIHFIFQMIRQITRKFTNPQEPLVYTSFGTDGLLQDYLTIAELIHAGYKDITVNIIQPHLCYSVWPYLGTPATRSHTHLKYHRKICPHYTQIMTTFKKKLAHLVASSSSLSDSTLNVRVFTSAHSYLNMVKNNPQEKSSLLLMVDPGHGVLAKSKQFAYTNTLKITLDDTNVALIFMPIAQKPQLYIKQGQNHSSDVTKKIETLTRILANVIITPSDNYRFSLFKKLVIDKIIPHDVTKSPQESLFGQKHSEVYSFYLDPYLAFQDLVRAGAKNGAIIYTLTNTINEDLQPTPVRIVPKLYIREENVVTSHNGLFYREHGFKRIA